MFILRRLAEQKLIHPPQWLPENTAYLTIYGSHAFGVADTNADEVSDMDIYGCCLPRLEDAFPHLKGEIIGFGRQKKRFEVWQQHHVFDKDALGGKGRIYDFSIFNIIKYFSLLMDNNPNIIDSIFTSQQDVVHCTQVGDIIRSNRRKFLHKGCYYRFKGYAYSQAHKMQSKDPQGKRKQIHDKYHMDVKFAMHLVRLLNECEQILIEGDLDLRRHSEQLKSIRRGEWSLEQVIDYFNKKESQLEELYGKSRLPHSPDEEALKEILLNCLESQYGSLEKAVVIPSRYESALREIRQVLDKTGVV